MKVLLAIVLVAVLAVAGGGYALLMREQGQLHLDLATALVAVKKMENETQALRTERDKLKSETKRLAQQVATVTQQAKALAEGQGVAAKSPAAGQGSSSVMGAAGGKPMKDTMTEMMKNPEMREMAKQQQIAMIDLQYGGLFSKFQLDDTEKANFKQLLAERVGLEADMTMRLIDDKLTPQQRQAMIKAMQVAKKQNDDKVRTFLNSEPDYQSFQNWEDTKNERMQLSMGQSAFSGTGEPLSTQQEQQLVDAMYQVRKEPSAVPDMSKIENFDPRHLDAAGLDRLMAKLDADAQRVYQRASTFLTPNQMKALKTMQEQQRSMAEYGLKMSASMMNGQPKK
ncbi:MAG: hypothetical protein ACOYOF_05470 [Verrucomicrobiaceae bacterium]